MNAHNPMLIFATLAFGLALPVGGLAADRQDGRAAIAGGRIAGTIELHPDGRVVRMPRHGPAPRHPGAVHPPADHAIDAPRRPPHPPAGGTIRTSTP